MCDVLMCRLHMVQLGCGFGFVGYMSFTMAAVLLVYELCIAFMHLNSRLLCATDSSQPLPRCLNSFLTRNMLKSV